MKAIQARRAAALAASVVVLALTSTAGAVVPADPAVVLDAGVAGTAEGAGRLAATANGQVLACIAGPAHAIIAVDPSQAGPGREIVSPPGAGAPLPLALAFIDTTVLAAVCRAEDDWSLRTWRLRPDGPVDPADSLQTTSLGTAGGSGDAVRLAVSRTRDWLVVTGLPTPLEPVLRAAIAGVRVGPVSSRHCPDVRPGSRPVAVTVGPLDELVLFERRSVAPAAGEPTASRAGVAEPGGDVVSFYDPTGTCLLRLDTGLTGIHDAAFAPGSAGLWVTAAGPTEHDGQSEQRGLWRLDATLRSDRQTIAAVPIGPLPGAVAVACPTEKAILVTQARERALRVVRIPLTSGEPP
jgi:hypothetical protein